MVGAVDEGGADVGFEPVELGEQVLVEQAERSGGGVDAGVGGGLLEAAQPLPAVAFAFGGVADVFGEVGVGATAPVLDRYATATRCASSEVASTSRAWQS